MSIDCQKQKTWYKTLGLVGFAIGIVFLVIPVVWRYSPWIQKKMLFQNYKYMPDVRIYNRPELYGMKGTRNFYINTSDHVSLGVWHVLPHNLVDKLSDEKLNYDYERLLSHGEPIFIYMHGNSGTRANKYRLALYHKFQAINCHVIALDYRSYADSTEADLNEVGLVTDVITTYKWVYERANGTAIFGWGHSLGTGIGAHAFALLEKENIFASGLVLEAPFNKISNAIRDYPTTKFFRNMPLFDFFIIDPIIENGIVFDTEENLKNAKVPVLILHARDDEIIPYQQSEQLYNFMANSRKSELTELVLYDADYGFGHQLIKNDKNIETKIKKFMEKCLKMDNTSTSIN